nr:hypothetical protein [Allomuricauda sp.]
MQNFNQFLFVPVFIICAGCSIDAIRINQVLEEEANVPEVKKSAECYSCIAKDGKKLELCDFQNGTFELRHGNDHYSLNTEDLEGNSAKKFVEIGCQLDVLDFTE